MHPNTILPSSPFVASYYIPVNSDNNTYYVQAIMYDALTGEVLATENLTRQTTNTRLYSKRMQSPGDSSSLGRKIVVVATAYTDSGYTAKSENYQDQAEVYLVRSQPAVLGGGGSFGTDYVKIRGIFTEELLKAIEDIKKAIKEIKSSVEGIEAKLPKISEMPFGKVFDAINVIQKSVSDIPKEKTNISPVIEALNGLKQAIEEVRADMPEATNLTSVLESINSLCEDIEYNQSENREYIEEKNRELTASLVKMFEENSSDKAKLQQLRSFVSKAVKQAQDSEDAEEDEMEQKKKINVEDLM